MADPFQDVDSAGPEFIAMFADSMDARQSDPTMERIVAAYLDQLDVSGGGLSVEVGAGAGAVTRRIAARFPAVRVRGFEPSQGFVAEARARGADHENLDFAVADGTSLPLEDAAANAVVLHTVLSHVAHPAHLMREAERILAPGGRLVICDADFSKASLASVANDPLDACAREFVRAFVTDAHITGRLHDLIAEAGLDLVEFSIDARVVTDNAQMRVWVEASTGGMVERGEMGPALAAALAQEYDRRAAAGKLYGFQAFATAIAEKEQAA